MFRLVLAPTPTELYSIREDGASTNGGFVWCGIQQQQKQSEETCAVILGIIYGNMINCLLLPLAMALKLKSLSSLGTKGLKFEGVHPIDKFTQSLYLL